MEAYLEIIFWIDMPLIAEYYEVPKKSKIGLNKNLKSATI